MKEMIDADNFIKDYNSNMTIEEIAKKYGYTSLSSVYKLIKKFGLPPRLNRWTKEKITLLKQNYPYADWNILLEILSPFKKEDIITKAYKLKIKRECYGYSPEDEQYLIDNYDSISIKELCDKLNKTEASIMTKANKMGLVKMEKWSNDDIEKLIKLYSYYTNEELLKFFPNRTITGISSMATMKLNLHKDEKYLSDKHYKQEKERMLKDLIKYANELERTPTCEEIQENKKLSGIASYHRIFGSYSEACQLAGLEVNANLFGSPIHYLSKNGDLCLSKKELEITNLLIDNNIKYKKEVLYRDILQDDELPYIRCDWLIDDVIVEYFGFPEKEDYKLRMNAKINLCKENNLQLIDLYQKDIRKKFKGLISKFAKYGIIIQSSI
jgi:hypothetical protein